MPLKLVKSRAQGRIRQFLMDQGADDSFFGSGGSYGPEVFAAACEQAGQSVSLRLQPGYDHSYYFIASFVGDHIRHHAAVLNAG